MDVLEHAADLVGQGKLERAAAVLRAALAEDPNNGHILLELGIAEKLLGKIDPAFDLLRRALEALPADDGEARLKARFVLGLTWGDVGRPRDAIASFEAAACEDGEERRVQAALHYAGAYREHHGIDLQGAR